MTSDTATAKEKKCAESEKEATIVAKVYGRPRQELSKKSEVRGVGHTGAASKYINTAWNIGLINGKKNTTNLNEYDG